MLVQPILFIWLAALLRLSLAGAEVSTESSLSSVSSEPTRVPYSLEDLVQASDVDVNEVMLRVHEILDDLRKNQESHKSFNQKKQPVSVQRISGFHFIDKLWALLRRMISVVVIQPESFESYEDPKSSSAETLLELNELLTIAGAHNVSEALYTLGELNMFGNFSYPQNYGRAYEWFKKAVQLDSQPNALFFLGFLHSTGLGNIDRHQGKALMYHAMGALTGNSKSQLACGYRHLMGIGTPKNCDTALGYYKTVAEKTMAWYNSGPPGGSLIPKFSIHLPDEQGGIYGSGASSSSPQLNRKSLNFESISSLDDVLEYLRYLAEKGDSAALLSLGRLYYDGTRTIVRNNAKALHYFNAAARMRWDANGAVIPGTDSLATSSAKAAGFIGSMYLRGEGVEANFDRAFLWFRRGSEYGDHMCQNGLAEIYRLGSKLIKPSPAKSFEYFKAAADQDYAPAQVNIAKILLSRGEMNVATRYFELAARHRHIEAYYYLAHIYSDGIGVEANCGMAAAYYKIVAERLPEVVQLLMEANEAYEEDVIEKALANYMIGSELGSEVSQCNAAYILENVVSRADMLVDKSLCDWTRELAFIHWFRSAKQTNIDSIVKVGDAYLGGVGAPLDLKNAYEFYQIAASLSSSMALWNIGWMHENGIGVIQDFHLAKRYYDQALAVNSESYLPVKLSLFKLYIRSFYNSVTGGKIKGVGNSGGVKKNRWSLSVAFQAIMKQWTEPEEQNGNQVEQPTYYDEHEEDIYGELSSEFEEDIWDSLIILGLCGTIAVLLYWRNQRQHGQRPDNTQEQGQEEQEDRSGIPNRNRDGNENLERRDNGLFPDVNDINNPELARWLGGVPGP